MRWKLQFIVTLTVCVSFMHGLWTRHVVKSAPNVIAYVGRDIMSSNVLTNIRHGIWQRQKCCCSESETYNTHYRDCSSYVLCLKNYAKYLGIPHFFPFVRCNTADNIMLFSTFCKFLLFFISSDFRLKFQNKTNAALRDLTVL